MSAELQASRHDATLLLTLANPGTYTLHPDMCAAAIEVLSTAERDDTIHAVVLTGSDAVFCLGMDVSHWLDVRTRDAAEPANSLTSLHGWIEAIRDCPKPVIAAVEGMAAGAGLSLVLACDLIVAGNSAQFAMPAPTIGLTPEGGAAWLLLQSLPRQVVGELLLEGKPAAATRLHALGVVNKLATDGRALDTALDWASTLGDLAHNALESTKALIGNALGSTLNQHFESEKQAFIEALYQSNAHEGMQAFLQKRPPQFK